MEVRPALEPVARIRFQTREGLTVLTSTKEFGDVRAGRFLPIVYDPRDPQRVRSAAASNDYVGVLLFAGSGSAMLIVAVMTAAARPPKWLWTPRRE
jgi:hypothetical protein